MHKLLSRRRKGRKHVIKYALAPTPAFVALPNSPLPVLVPTPIVKLKGKLGFPGKLLQIEGQEIAGQEAEMPSTGMPSIGMPSGANSPTFFQLTMSSNPPIDRAPTPASPCCVRNQSPSHKPIGNIWAESEPGYSTIRKLPIGSNQGIPGAFGSNYIARPLPDPPNLTVKSHPRVAGLKNTERDLEYLSNANQNITESREPAVARTLHQYNYPLKPTVSSIHESQRKDLLYNKVANHQIASVGREWKGGRRTEFPSRAQSPQYVTTECDSLSLSRETERGEVKRKDIYLGQKSQRFDEKSRSPNKGRSPQRVHSHKQQGWPMRYRDVNTERNTESAYLSPEEDSCTTESFSEDDECCHPDCRRSKETSERGYHSGPTLHSSAMTKFENRRKGSSSRSRMTYARTLQRSASTHSSWDGIPVIQPYNVQQAFPATMNKDVFVFSERQPDGTLQYYAASPVQSSTPVCCYQDSGHSPVRIQDSGHLPVSSYPPIQRPVFPSNTPTSLPHTTTTTTNQLTESGHITASSFHKPQNNLLNQHLLRSQVTSHSLGKISAATLGCQSCDNDSLRVISPAIKVTSHSEPSSRCDVGEKKRFASVGDSVSVDIDIQAYTAGRKQKEKKNKLVEELVKLLVTEKKALRKERENTRIREGQIGKLKTQIALLNSEKQGLVEDKMKLEIERKRLYKTEERESSLVYENAALQRKLEALGRDEDRIRKGHLSTISRLTDELQTRRQERIEMDDGMQHLRENHTFLHHQFDKLKESVMKRVPLKEHKQALDDMQRFIDNLAEKNKETFQSKDNRIRVQVKYNNALKLKLTEARSLIEKLKEDNRRMHISFKKAEKRSRALQYELEHCKDKEVIIHKQLSQVVAQAEKTMADKTTLERMAEAQRLSAERAIVSKTKNEVALTNMEKKVDAYEKETNLALDKASKILQRNEKDQRHQKERYVDEIKHLRNLLNRRQKQLEQLSHEKRAAEGRLSYVYDAHSTYTGGDKLGYSRGKLLRAPEYHRNRFIKSWT